MSNSDNITADNTPQFIESVPAGTVVRLFSGAIQLGIDTDTSTGLYDITTSALPNGQAQIAACFEDLAGNFAANGPALTVTIDTIAPALSLSAFDFAVAHQLRFQFSEVIGPAVPVSSLNLNNLTTNSTIPSNAIAVISAGSTASFTFPGLSGGILPDGNYRATLAASGVSDLAGNPPASSPILDFFVLSGDANHDRAINFPDLVAVAQNYGATAGATFAKGDFNYDGKVDFADLVTVAQKYGTTLAPPAASPVPAAAAPAVAVSAARKAIKPLFSATPILKPAASKPKPPARLRHR